MWTGSLRGAPLEGLVQAHYTVHAGPCCVICVASAWRKKLQTRKCGSAYPNCAICSPRCYGAGGTALSTYCIGPSGEDDINSEPCAATIESAVRLYLHSIYNCSTSACGGGGNAPNNSGNTNPGQAPVTDSVSGTVRFKGAPLAGATVMLWLRWAHSCGLPSTCSNSRSSVVPNGFTKIFSTLSPGPRLHLNWSGLIRSRPMPRSAKSSA